MAEIIGDKQSCPHCGAPLPLKAGEIIVVCEYCSSAIELAAHKTYFIKHSIIPACTDEKGIRERIRAWMKGGFYKPSDLAARAEIKKIECTYMPFFVFDVHAETWYEGRRIRTGKEMNIEDNVRKDLMWKVLARRASKFPTMEYKIPLEGKEDFNIGKMAKGSKFLNAEMDEEEAMRKAEGLIHKHLLQLAESRVDKITNAETKCEFRSTEFVHAPVWRVLYEYDGKFYKMYMDGGSGDTIRAEVPAPDTSLKGLARSVKDII